MKKKKILICLLLIVTLNLFICYRVKAMSTIADSGFGTSYSSGSSHSSSYSSSSGSSSHSSSSSSSYGSSKDWNEMSVFEKMIIIYSLVCITIPLFIIFKSLRSTPTTKIRKLSEKQKMLIENKIKQYIHDFDKDKFLADGYQIYLDVQEAWMNFKLDDVKGKITDEMFNMYESQLATLQVKGQQNIMKDFNLVNSYLSGVNVQNDNINIKTVFMVDFYDYIIEEPTGKILRGTDKNKLRITYEMEFRKTLNKDKVTMKCPNCGAEIKNINGYGECEFCRTKIVTENQEWVLTNKKTVSQITL